MKRSALALALGLLSQAAIAQTVSQSGLSGFVGARVQTNGASPTGTASASGVMMGLSSGTSIITPVSTGKISITIKGMVTNNTNTDSCATRIRWGTGSAPANGDALTGTIAGPASAFTGMVAAAQQAFVDIAIVSNLSINTPVWIDESLTTPGGGICTIVSVTMVVVEL